MSAKTLMVNEGILQGIEERIAVIRELGTALVKGFADPKYSFGEGLDRASQYGDAMEVLQELSQQLFHVVDLCDPEDGELARRDEEDEDEDEAEDDEDGEDEEDEDGEDEEEA